MEEAKPAKSKKPTYTDSEGNGIKKNVAAYYHFVADKGAELKGMGLKSAEVSPKLSEMWKQLSKEDRAKYEELAAKDKVRGHMPTVPRLCLLRHLHGTSLAR